MKNQDKNPPSSLPTVNEVVYHSYEKILNLRTFNNKYRDEEEEFLPDVQMRLFLFLYLEGKFNLVKQMDLPDFKAPIYSVWRV